jgi:hypothetical protein
VSLRPFARRATLNMAESYTGRARFAAAGPHLETGGGAVKKLELKIEELKVESFDVDAGERRRGTVQGREDSAMGTGCDSADGCCGANTRGDACGTSGDCDDISVCYGGLC